MLIGETEDIRSRLNQYKTGTQETGNYYWREQFLKLRDIGCWILKLKKCESVHLKIDKNLC